MMQSRPSDGQITQNSIDGFCMECHRLLLKVLGVIREIPDAVG